VQKKISAAQYANTLHNLEVNTNQLHAIQTRDAASTTLEKLHLLFDNLKPIIEKQCVKVTAFSANFRRKGSQC
jgi:hypothetical protein